MNFKTMTFVELQYRYKNALAARNSALMLHDEPGVQEHEKIRIAVKEEVARRERGAERIANFNRKFKRRTL